MAMSKEVLGELIRNSVYDVPYSDGTTEDDQRYLVEVFEAMANAFISHIQDNAVVSVTGNLSNSMVYTTDGFGAEIPTDYYVKTPVTGTGSIE